MHGFRSLANLSILLFILFSPSECASDSISPFSPAIPRLAHQYNDDNWQHDDIFKRADNCPAGSGSCAYMGYANYCCKGNANCAIDNVGHVACCQVGAQCTGTIAGPFATRPGGSGGSTSNGDSNGQGTSTASLVPAAQATGDYSVVANPYYPFRAIPTTYANAAGCSAAWTGCQSDMTRCTAYLQGQPQQTTGAGSGGTTGNGGVTISAPNGGVTVNGQANNLPSVTITMAPASASSICSSLSMQGCSGLQVTACSVFGGANNAGRACGSYGAAFGGAAVGLAGQLLLA